jgi:hypothetical protein
LACFPKRFSPGQESALVEEWQSLLGALGVDSELMPASKWFTETFSRHGDWDSWVWETVHGKDYMTRELHFRGFVIHGREVGRQTANIARTALASSRVVLSCVDGVLYAVTDVAERDKDRWSDGWSLVLAPIGD